MSDLSNSGENASKPVCCSTGSKEDPAGPCEVSIDVLYSSHCQLFQHYSSLVFTARVSTITVTILVALLSFNVFGGQFVGGSVSTVAEAIGTLTFLSTVLILALWFMEIGYLWKFYCLICTIRSMRKRELVPDFFREYKRFRHIGVPIYYVLAVIWLLYRARELGFLTGKNWFWLALPGVMLIVASWLYVVFTMKQMEQSDCPAASSGLSEDVQD